MAKKLPEAYYMEKSKGLNDKELFNENFIKSGTMKETNVIDHLDLIPYGGLHKRDATSHCGRHIEIKSMSLGVRESGQIKSLSVHFANISYNTYDRMINNNELVVHGYYNKADLVAIICHDFKDIAKGYLHALKTKGEGKGFTLTIGKFKGCSELVYLTKDKKLFPNYINKSNLIWLNSLKKTNKKYLKMKHLKKS
jgi:hypothetical protein